MKKILHSLNITLMLIAVVISGYSLSQTYTFTTGGAVGNTGPSQAMMDAAYTGTSLDGDVTVTAGIQYWVVPATATYIIEAYGAQGYGDYGGRGAHISGEFNLVAGQTIKILVGQKAGDYLNYPSTTYNHQFGGGGGSFVTETNNTPLVVAGGGGGNHSASYLPECDGQITNNGANGALGSITGTGGTAGSGGTTASSADGGGGLLGDGTGGAPGLAFVNGGLGGSDEGTGGFGCGGGTSSWNNYRGGGGGGYSGGGGGNTNSSTTCCSAGGGGGSYNAGTNPVNLAGVQLGDGLVVITVACTANVGSLVEDVATLSDVTADCVVTSLTPPTASNSCLSGIEGTYDVTLPVNTVGTTVVTWTYDDGVNTITQTQNIVISGIDNDPPVVDNPNLMTFGSQCSFNPPIPTATDVCAGTVYGVSDLPLPITTQGTNTITWTFDDGSGNTVTQTQTININDVAAPAPDVASLPTLNACASATPTTPTATDNCAGTINGVPDVSFPITTPGITTVTWTYDDGNGNVSSQTQDVDISTIDLSVSVTSPTITALQTGATYQWYDCGNNQNIAETGQSYTATVTGEYAVIITNGSCSDTSVCTLIDFAGIEELNSNLITIYPNPTKTGVFTVDFDGTVDEIFVYDALGRSIELPVDLTSGKVDGSALEAGTYTVKVISSDVTHTKTIIVID